MNFYLITVVFVTAHVQHAVLISELEPYRARTVGRDAVFQSLIEISGRSASAYSSNFSYL